MSYAPINHSLDFMQEIPHFFNPVTGREEPIDGAGPIGTYRGGAEMEPIGTYKGGATIKELPFLENFMKENIATNYNDLKGWEKDILQCGLAVRSGSSWDKELCRLQKMYPGFMPRV